MSKLKIIEQKSGDTVIITKEQDYNLAQKCCDCGLFHLWNFRIAGDEIHITIERLDGEKDILEYDLIPHDTIRDGTLLVDKPGIVIK